MIILFLDFDGVLHSDAVYRTRNGLELRAEGSLMMHAPALENLLNDFPTVRIVLSTSWVRMLGFRRAKAALSPGLQARVISATWHSAMPRAPLYGYDLQTRYEQVKTAAGRDGYTRWIALDDDPDFSWVETDNRLVRTDSVVGLGDPQVLIELHNRLALLCVEELISP